LINGPYIISFFFFGSNTKISSLKIEIVIKKEENIVSAPLVFNISYVELNSLSYGTNKVLDLKDKSCAKG
jgi:hypothetical protein